jgi:transcriptional regulator with XRE-family HTH domain
MIIGDRLRVLREQKKFSQGEIERRTGLLRCYISRVENGHTVPAVETLEKFARQVPPIAQPGGRRGPALAPVHGEKDGEDEDAVNGRCGRSASSAPR